MKKIIPEVYSRVCGYFRPTSQFNKGKQSEFKDRYNHNPKDLEKHLK
jgi:anaerobic ribonucleoside-triphosphate reductase